MTDFATMHIDGAARGNPGPAAYAVVIARPGEPVVERYATMGTASNNVAEYTALVRGLERAADLRIKRLAVYSDSELLVKQMNGEYRVKHEDLLPLYRDAKELAKEFDEVTIAHVRRGQNARADELCNIALDGEKPPRTKQESTKPAAPAKSVNDDAVRPDALAILQSAAVAWAGRGLGAVPVAAVWEQLWSVLEEGGVLKKKK